MAFELKKSSCYNMFGCFQLITLKRFLAIIFLISSISFISWLVEYRLFFRPDLQPKILMKNPLEVSFKCSANKNITFKHHDEETLFFSMQNLEIHKPEEKAGNFFNCLVIDSGYPKSLKPILDNLESLQINYKVISITRLVSFLAQAEKNNYSFIIFEDYQNYWQLNTSNQNLLNKFCKQNFVSVIGLLPRNDQNLFYNNSSNDSSFTLVNLHEKVEYYHVSNYTDILQIVKRNTFINWRPKKTWTGFQLQSSSNFIALAELIHRDDSNSNFYIKTPTIIYGHETPSKSITILFGSGLNFWMNKLIFIDVIHFLTARTLITSQLDRHVLIDIDDIFVGQKGTRLRFEDVQELILAQKRIRQNLVKNFQFNLGFSGKYFHRGLDEEDFGDDALIKHSKEFWWFGHMWGHLQPHLFLNISLLENQMNMNKEFAQKHDIPVHWGYAVAPHHSGVYPVHEPLYEAWKNVWGINVTSTEEYPRLMPARKRKGFIHKGIQVLPRQTCGLYTHTINIDKYPGGHSRLERSIFGGDLFFLFVFNKINIFMTHMSNYGNDRLGIYTFESVFRFIKCFTNLRLETRNPNDLGKEYFKNNPKEVTPIWTNPCNDKRHYQIWANKKHCHKFPSILIVGPQKTGTSALHAFLNMHSSIKSNLVNSQNFEEIQFFNNEVNYANGINWYLEQFPNATIKNMITFEKSANYFDSEIAALRASQLLPTARIIVLIIDPINRAYSWYQHMKYHGNSMAKNNTFLQVLQANQTSSLRSLRNRCLFPGHYAVHLERWLTKYNKKQILVLDGEQLKSDPISLLNGLQFTLKVKPFIDYRKKLKFSGSKGFFCPTNVNGKLNCLGRNKGRKYEKMTESARQFLTEYYRPHNLNLFKILIKLGQRIPAWLRASISQKN